MSHSPTPPTIRLRGLDLTLTGPAGAVNILRGVDLTVDQGAAVGVVGPSGAGKSSLLMVIAGLQRPTAGAVTVAGHDLGAMDEDALARWRRAHVGVVFQGFHLIPTMTAEENVAVPLEFAGRRDAFDVARGQLEAVGLGHRLGHYPGQLSGGEQQRVALARAFAPGPRLLLADEPTGNLDGETGALVMDLLFRLHAEQNTTLMLITHDLALARRCDRTIRIEDGRLTDSGASRAAAE
ncbi:ABC transporter ATP-binding protein [Roseospira goensis]|uniref:Putative ABC transport system ATP-binding protein n=1 Tax=Roseospira goensis TaxID=391922 RepID=A0A7W6S0A0_9PROT|nr:ATP-binding cassette domain-containing protein [Roseospira goensis]MBB4286488.1 putative ABC transport system ATP-binding protein [Roseospira goensis]